MKLLIVHPYSNVAPTSNVKFSGTSVLSCLTARPDPNRNSTEGSADLISERAWAALVLLGAFETEMAFVLSNQQEIIRVRSERAFAHLQRSIVADPEFGKKWRKAFKDGEVACEKLGGAHLLAHGIFAFKVDAEGERTDLVFQDIVGNDASEERYAEGIVLTEWKVARSDGDAEKRFSDAKRQADRYASGALGGSELAGYRYLVIVSGPQVKVPADITEGSVRYRHVNIAICFRTRPSAASTISRNPVSLRVSPSQGFCAVARGTKLSC